jgi:hypothetical protein
MIKFYALGTSEADAMVDCTTGKYSKRPFFPRFQEMNILLVNLKKDNSDYINLRVYVIKVA